MRPISAAKCSSVHSLLEKGYSHHQIHNKTGVGMGTISRIGREVNTNKENNSGGHPAKLSAHDKQSILCQITSVLMKFKLPASYGLGLQLQHVPSILLVSSDSQQSNGTGSVSFDSVFSRYRGLFWASVYINTDFGSIAASRLVCS